MLAPQAIPDSETKSEQQIIHAIIYARCECLGRHKRGCGIYSRRFSELWKQMIIYVQGFVSITGVRAENEKGKGTRL